MAQRFAAVLLATAAAVAAVSATSEAAAPRVLYLPLDERYTTRDAFLNLAKATPFEVVTPPPSLLCHQKTPANLTALHAWVDENMGQVDTAIISAELYLYGGLIASRSSNDTTAEVMARLTTLAAYKSQYPQLRLYLSTVVMRIPAYNEDVEEPWYWALYGLDLYTYSYYTDKYNHTHDPADLAKAQAAEALVPPAIVQQFLWRRQRNFNVTAAMLKLLDQAPGLFQNLYINQDDNAQYGFNIEEANRLRAIVHQDKLLGPVLVYPGADEVGLTLLSRMCVDYMGRSPVLQLVFRDPATVNLIPNYEGQPMYMTLLDQIQAAGGTPSNDTQDSVLLVNNFSHFPQTEAPNQSLSGRSVEDYRMFDEFVCNQSKVLGFADNRYSNGADVVLMQYITQFATNASCMLHMQRFAYAGWNTDGNTLGTVISNTILLSLFQQGEPNTLFNVLRMVEDWHYQAGLRQLLVAYVSQVNGDSVTDLSHDLPFYDRFAYKVLNSYFEDLTQLYEVPWVLESTYYPWNRTFEIGFVTPDPPPRTNL